MEEELATITWLLLWVSHNFNLDNLLGLKEDVHQIKGLYEAWGDLEHPVFVSRDHPTWRSNDHKPQKYHYNYTSGDAYFCIPPYPYKGESKD